MAQLINAWITKEKLETMLKALNSRNQQGIGITIAVNNKAFNYNQNVVGYVSQSKEQREAGKEKFYILNGNTVWSDKGEAVFKKEGSQKATSQAPGAALEEEDDLPF